MACMGGWCRKREQCADYHDRKGFPVERFCEPGKDEPTPMLKQEWRATWPRLERTAPAGPFNGLEQAA